MKNVEIDPYALDSSEGLNQGYIVRKPNLRGPRNFMLLPDCSRHLTVSGTGTAHCTAIFAEDREENAILTRWYQHNRGSYILDGKELTDAVCGQYGPDDNFYVITLDPKVAGFKKLATFENSKAKFEEITKEPEGFKKIKDE